jgi:hypothetical protein
LESFLATKFVSLAPRAPEAALALRELRSQLVEISTKNQVVCLFFSGRLFQEPSAQHLMPRLSLEKPTRKPLEAIFCGIFLLGMLTSNNASSARQSRKFQSPMRIIREEYRLDFSYVVPGQSLYYRDLKKVEGRGRVL